MKKLYILFLTLLLSMIFATNVFAVGTLTENQWHDIWATQSSPDLSGSRGALTIHVDQIHALSWFALPDTNTFGKLKTTQTYVSGSGNQYVEELQYIDPSGVTTLVATHTGLSGYQWLGINITVFAYNGSKSVDISSASGEFPEIVPLLTSYTGTFVAPLYNSTTDSLLKYYYSSTGNVPQVAGARVVFTLPSTDITETLESYSFATFGNIPVRDSATDADIVLTVTGVVPGSLVDTYKLITYKTDSDGVKWAEIFYNFTAKTSVGVNNIGYNVSYDGSDYPDSIVYTRVTGVVDANNDGIDDRTGKSIKTANPDGNWANADGSPNRTDFENTVYGGIEYGIANLKWTLSRPFAYIAEALSTISSWLDESASWIASVTSFFGAIFGFLPAPFVGGLVAIFSTIVLFTIIRIIRG